MNTIQSGKYSPHFQGRNKTIRFADDVMRKVNQCFPLYSATKLECFNNIEHFQSYLYDCAIPKIRLMREYKNDLYDDCLSVPAKLITIVKTALKFKVGNCGEKAQLSAIVSQINGIKDCHIAALYTNGGRSLDHSVLFVNAQKPYIIDPWCGFADYYPNAVVKYENEFGDIFELRKGERVTLVSEIDDEFTEDLRHNFSRGQLNKVLKILPTMKIRKY